MWSDAQFWPRFVVACLATWRVAHLLAREDGPWDVVVRLRARAGTGVWGALLDCMYCLSLWIAAPFTAIVTMRLAEFVPVWLAISAAACLLERATAPAVTVEPLAVEPTGGPTSDRPIDTRNGGDDVLWTEARQDDGADDREPAARSGSPYDGGAVSAADRRTQ